MRPNQSDIQFPESIFKKGEMTMKADQIIKNAKIYTADKNQPMAAAFAAAMVVMNGMCARMDSLRM